MNRKQIKRLEELSGVFATLDKLSKAGMLSWDEKHRRLYIADPLATVMLSKGRQGWVNFLNNIFLYVSYNFLAEKWDSKYSVLCAKELSKAKKLTPELATAETQRIRRMVADKMSDSDVRLPQLEPFEFYIVSDENSALLQCGVYDPNTDLFDIANLDEISDHYSGK